MSRGTTWLLLATMMPAAGCTCHLSCVPPIEMDLAEAICSISQQSRCHVYLFFVQGLDPLDCANLEDLKETTQAMGFPNAWYGASYHLKQFKKIIADVYQQDPKARFVIVCYDSGISTAQELASSVAVHDATIDLMICVGRHAERPTFVSRLVNILPEEKGCDETAIVDGEVHHVKEKKHHLPMHRETVEIVARELLGLAAHIPSEADLPRMIYPDHEPTPRPVMPPADKAGRDEWDFLKPASVERHTAIPPDSVPEYRPARKKKAEQVRYLPGDYGELRNSRIILSDPLDIRVGVVNND